MATFADDTALLASDNDPQNATEILRHLHMLERWYQKWRININENISVYITFTMRKRTCPPVTINGTVIPTRDSVK